MKSDLISKVVLYSIALFIVDSIASALVGSDLIYMVLYLVALYMMSNVLKGVERTAYLYAIGVILVYDVLTVIGIIPSIIFSGSPFNGTLTWTFHSK